MPRVKNSKRTQTNLPAADTADNITNRASLRPEDVCVGGIVWLPSKSVESDDLYYQSRDGLTMGKLDDRGYDHPVIVLSVHQRTGSRVTGDITVSIALVRPLSKHLQFSCRHSLLVSRSRATL